LDALAIWLWLFHGHARGGEGEKLILISRHPALIALATLSPQLCRDNRPTIASSSGVPAGIAHGWTSLTPLISFIGGVQMVFLGVIAEYLWRTSGDVKCRYYGMDIVHEKKKN